MLCLFVYVPCFVCDRSHLLIRTFIKSLTLCFTEAKPRVLGSPPVGQASLQAQGRRFDNIFMCLILEKTLPKKYFLLCYVYLFMFPALFVTEVIC